MYLYIYLVDYFYSILDQEKNYLTAASKLPVLDKTLVFSEYLFQDTVLPIGGVTSMSIGKEVIMFTFNDHIYISQIGKVYINIYFLTNMKPCIPIMLYIRYLL